MAFLSIPNVRVAGVAAGVPKNKVCNLHPDEHDAVSTEYSPEDYVALTGVEERRTSKILTTSDLCLAAAEQLIVDLGWQKSDIDALIFVSQTADYILPATACILQNRLGLSKECYAEDISLGCSGWVYGLSTAASLCANGSIKKALLLVGDAKSRVKGLNNPLFGSAATATAVEYCPGVPELKFHLGTDGSGYDAIIIPDGGCRNQFTPKSFDLEDVDGKKLNRLQSRMKGMDVFAFGITTAPKSVKRLAEHFSFDYLDYDYFVFHQANKKLNETIAKKLKLDPARVPFGMKYFGNTSSASIPLAIVSELKHSISKRNAKLICCGFGVGLSWGTVAFETQNMVVSSLVEVEDDYYDDVWV